MLYYLNKFIISSKNFLKLKRKKGNSKLLYTITIILKIPFNPQVVAVEYK